MATAVTVRTERADDVRAVARVVGAAFAGDASGTPPEVALVDRLRADTGAWLPGLSLVAEVDGRVVGHALLTRLRVGGAPALALAPVAVEPEQQGRGVGSTLVRAALREAEREGERLVVVLGDPGYYGRFGFRPASEFGITGPYGAGPAFQALALGPGAPRGEAVYPAAFAGV